jgi:hypothetical protein
VAEEEKKGDWFEFLRLMSTVLVMYQITNCKIVCIRNMNDNQGSTQGGEGRAAAPPKPPKPKLEKNRFCRYYGIKSFT